MFDDNKNISTIRSCLYFWDEVLFTFFGLLSSSLLPCLSQCFSHCTLLSFSGGWNVKLNPSFRLLGKTVLVPLMSVISYLLLISPLKVLHCLHRVLNSYSLGMSLDLTNAFIHCAICPWGHLCMSFLILQT